MNEKSKEKDRNGLEPRGSSEGNERKRKQDPALRPKPHWPTGLQLLPSNDVTCFIPENPAVILSREAFQQLFSYAYSTSSEICCLGTVTQKGERFRIERFYLVGQTGRLGHTELNQGAVAALVEGLAQGKGDEAHSLTGWAAAGCGECRPPS